MRNAGDIWEYIFVYVDDLIMVMKDAKGLFDKLMSLKIGSTMKGVGKPTYHLGVDFFCDNDGALSLGSKTYSKCLCFMGRNQNTYLNCFILRITLSWTIHHSVVQMTLPNTNR